MIRLQDKNTHFHLPIIDPMTRETVSAEQLYNSACEALGYQVTTHIADLVFDNLDYGAAPYDEADLAPHIYAWARSIRTTIGA